MENSFCNDHKEVIRRMGHCEGNIKKLWGKFDNIQKTTLGIFIVLSLNLIAVIAILLKGGVD